MKRHVLPSARGSDATYTYDSTGNILTRSAPDTTTYSYDALDRFTREQGPALTQSFGYDANGNRTQAFYSTVSPAGTATLQRVLQTTSGTNRVSGYTQAYKPAGSTASQNSMPGCSSRPR
jgi:YD repeat-containing protein